MSSSPDETIANIAEEVIRDLGGVDREFRAGIENIIAGWIFVVLLIGGAAIGLGFIIYQIIAAGGNLPVYVEKGMSWSAAGLMLLLSSALAAGGIFLAICLPGMASAVVYLCPNGLVRVDRRKIEVYRWEQIDHIEEEVNQEHFPLHGVARYAVPVGKSHSYLVHRNDGDKVAFNGTSVKKIRTLGRLLREAAEKHQIPWKITERSG